MSDQTPPPARIDTHFHIAPQLRHPRPAPVGDLHTDNTVPCPDRDGDRLARTSRPAVPAYQAAYDLVLRLRARTGIAFDPHWFRHSAATRWLRDGVPIEVVSTLLGHSSVSVTSSVYGHLTAEDARTALEKAGWFTGKEVSW
jgi:integrase